MGEETKKVYNKMKKDEKIALAQAVMDSERCTEEAIQIAATSAAGASAMET